MKEFGSDFHYYATNDFKVENELSKLDASFYANGRQAIQDLIENNSWKRIWIPTYYCYDVIDSIKATGITIKLYACLLYTSDAADDLLCVDLGGRRIIK